MRCQRRGLAQGHGLLLPCLAQRFSGISTGPSLEQRISEVQTALLSVALLQTASSLEAFHSQNRNLEYFGHRISLVSAKSPVKLIHSVTGSWWKEKRVGCVSNLLFSVRCGNIMTFFSDLTFNAFAVF